MKRLFSWILLPVTLVLATAGCKKETSEWTTAGTRVSLTELREAFQDVQDKEVQAALNDTLVSIRVGQYATTLAALEKLANYSSATSQQKKVAATVTSQVKQMAAKAQAAPGK